MRLATPIRRAASTLKRCVLGTLLVVFALFGIRHLTPSTATTTTICFIDGFRGCALGLSTRGHLDPLPRRIHDEHLEETFWGTFEDSCRLCAARIGARLLSTVRCRVRNDVWPDDLDLDNMALDNLSCDFAHFGDPFACDHFFTRVTIEGRQLQITAHASHTDCNGVSVFTEDGVAFGSTRQGGRYELARNSYFTGVALWPERPKEPSPQPTCRSLVWSDPDIYDADKLRAWLAAP